MALMSLPGLLLLFLVTSPAYLQAETRSEYSWSSLGELREGDKIDVVQMNFKRVTGTFLGFSDDALTLRAKNSEISISREQVLRVSSRERSKRVRNMLIGLAVGAATGAVIGASLDAKSGESGEHLGLILFTPFGLGVGAGVGAAVPGYETIYRAGPEAVKAAKSPATASRFTEGTP